MDAVRRREYRDGKLVADDVVAMAIVLVLNTIGCLAIAGFTI
jgi:hypothetical protein